MDTIFERKTASELKSSDGKEQKMLYYEFYKTRKYIKNKAEAEKEMTLPTDAPVEIFDSKGKAMDALNSYGNATIKRNSYLKAYELEYAIVVECEGEKDESGNYELTGSTVDYWTSELEKE